MSIARARALSLSLSRALSLSRSLSLSPDTTGQSSNVQPTNRVHRPPDISAVINHDADIPILDDTSSVMGHYLHKVYERLGIEVTGNVDGTGVRGEAWLMKNLGDNNFWVRAEQARSICKRLNITFQEPSYHFASRRPAPGHPRWAPTDHPYNPAYTYHTSHTHRSIA